MSTYSPNDALTMAKAMNHKVPQSGIEVYVCDFVQNQIWTEYYWNWTLGTLTPITCADGTQDYTPTNTDILRFRDKWLRIVRTDLTPVEYRELGQKESLAVELTMKGGLESIRLFSYEGEIGKIRLDRAASVPSGTVLQIQGKYQKIPTKITASTLTSTMALPDHYFNVYLSGVRWYLYHLADDPRAGTMVLDHEGRAKYTGQLAEFKNQLFLMKQAEDTGSGEDNNYPENSFSTGRDYSPRIFG